MKYLEEYSLFNDFGQSVGNQVIIKVKKRMMKMPNEKNKVEFGRTLTWLCGGRVRSDVEAITIVFN